MAILDRDLGLRVLKCIPALGSLTEEQRERVVKAFKTVSYNDGQVVLRSVGASVFRSFACALCPM